MSDTCGMNEARSSKGLLGLSILPYLNNIDSLDKLTFICNTIVRYDMVKDLKEVVVTIRLTEKEAQKVRDFCEKYGYTLSEYFRELMQIHLGTQGFDEYRKTIQNGINKNVSKIT